MSPHVGTSFFTSFDSFFFVIQNMFVYLQMCFIHLLMVYAVGAYSITGVCEHNNNMQLLNRI